MERDGKNESAWQNMDLAKQVNSKIPPETYDVLIVGAGITGVSTALALQQKGMNCLLLDSAGIGYGTTGGTSAHLNTVLDTPYSEIEKLHDKKKTEEVIQSVLQANETIQRNIEKYSIECDYHSCIGYMYAKDDKEAQELQEIQKALESYGISCLAGAEVPLPVFSTYAIEFNKQARFHPLKYVSGLLSAYMELGGKVSLGARVSRTTEKSDVVEVETTSTDPLYARYVVFATHTPPGIQVVHFKLAPYRSYVQLWDLGYNPTMGHSLVYDMEDPFHYWRIVEYQGKKCILVGGQDHKTAHHDNEPYNFLELEAFVKDLFPHGKKILQWSSQYYESPDALPFVGTAPNSSKVFLATGYGGNGMIFGTLSANILCDLITTGSSPYKDLYSPSRIGPISGLWTTLKENIDVGKHFFIDRMQLEELTALAALSPGEGKVVEYQGNRIGVVKDQVGKLFAVDPVCRHAGCIVKWNAAEDSWDCPCHGARYDRTGKVLTGPSTENLKSWDFEAEKWNVL